MNKQLRALLTIIIILILIALNIYIFILHEQNKSSSATNSIQNIARNNSINNVSEQEIVQQNKIEEKISNMSERNRIQTYFGEFVSYIETKNYEKAYAVLNSNFKNSYFATIEKFKNYVQSKYPQDMVINYKNLERQGEIYVLSVEIKDAFNTNYKTLSQRIVIRENEIDDFSLSFQVE